MVDHDRSCWAEAKKWMKSTLCKYSRLVQGSTADDEFLYIYAFIYLDNVVILSPDFNVDVWVFS